MGRPSNLSVVPLSRLPRTGLVVLHRYSSGGFWWRTCQVVAMTTALVSLYTFVLLYISVASMTRQQKPRPVMWLRRDQLQQMPPEEHLIDLLDFHYVLQPRGVCDLTSGHQDGKGLDFVIYVHSSPDHIQERQIIRSTWGSMDTASKWGIKIIFLLGRTMHHLQEQLEEENKVNGDLVQGSFVDSYRNLSYKHLMGYKWILSNCPKTTYIVKVDDDCFVDVNQLHELLQNMYGHYPTGVLACSVWPAGSAAKREPTDKWAVSLREYPYDVYPAYCGGLAYVISPDIAKDVLSASRYVPFFWIDDVYVTGLLAEALPHVRHHALNLRISYDVKVLLHWLHETADRPCPFVFGDVSGSNHSATMRRLWQKSCRVRKTVTKSRL